VARRSNFIISQPFILLANTVIGKKEHAVANSVFFDSSFFAKQRMFLMG